MVVKKKNYYYSGGLLMVAFAVGLIAFYPTIIGTEKCSIAWKNLTEKVNINSTFPSLAKYYCSTSANITREECIGEYLHENVKGCSWGVKTTNFGKTLYQILDPVTTLTISGTTTLCGDVTNYSEIYVTSTGTLHICAYNGTQGTGYLNISLLDTGNFTVELGGKIVGDYSVFVANGTTNSTGGAAWQGFDGNNSVNGSKSTSPNGGGAGGGSRISTSVAAAGGGGGFGGIGGNGGYSATSATKGSGGLSYVSSDIMQLYQGSGGGGGSGDSLLSGGFGGTGLKVNATNGTINIKGIINLSGQAGLDGNSADTGAGGGGSGGHLILIAEQINISSAQLLINGGRGGNTLGGTSADDCSGGGGSGGRIVLNYHYIYNSSTLYNVSGGGIYTAGCTNNPTIGGNGTVLHTTYPDAIAPEINIVYPVNGTNITIRTDNINYTVTDDTGVSSCWWTNDDGATNNTITCGKNITNYWENLVNNVTIYVNDTSNNINYTSVTFNATYYVPETSLNISLSAGTKLTFLPNASVVSCIPAYNQTANKSLFEFYNNASYIMVARAKLNATNVNITIGCYSENDCNKAVNLTTAYKSVSNFTNVNATNYIWCWASFKNVSSKWSPKWSIIGDGQ